MRVRGGAGHDEGHAAVGTGDRRDPGGRVGDDGSVERPDLGEDVQRVERGSRLAVGIAHVGLEGVAEAAVGVAVGAEGVQHGPDRRPVQVHREPMALEQAGVREDEPLGGGDVDGGVERDAQRSSTSGRR